MMSNTAPRTGMATPEQLQQLHRAVVVLLLAKLKTGKPSADDLAVCRSMLKDNGLAGLAQSDKDRASLQKLWGLLLSQLTKAMESNRPPASVMEETRHFLAASGITKDLQGHTGKVQALAALTDASLPFTTH